MWIGKLVALKVPYLYGFYKITDAGVQYLAPLMCVPKLGMCHCNSITAKATSYLVGLVGLKDLDLRFYYRLSDSSIRNLGSLTALTRVRLNRCGKHIRCCY